MELADCGSDSDPDHAAMVLSEPLDLDPLNLDPLDYGPLEPGPGPGPMRVVLSETLGVESLGGGAAR